MRLNEYNSWLDELEVADDNPIRDKADELVDFAYESSSISGNARSIEAAATYTAILLEGTLNPQYDGHHYSQEEISNLAGISDTTLRRHYKRICEEKGLKR